MFQSRPFWIGFALLALACAAGATAYFPDAFPLVTLDLRMDRETALAEARHLAERHGWGPGGYRQAASFVLDERTQTYVELEAGGTGAFRRMLAEGLYSPYTWRVRHFRGGETLETAVRFTPDGRPYGFVVKRPEDEPGAAIDREEARALAEQGARKSWGIDLDPYELVETAQEVRPGGRKDHTFVYRRRVERIGEAEYRLRLVVGGDALTELTHFIKVPEAFERRYEEMRAANDSIATASAVVTVVAYLLAGCLGGLFYLARNRWVLPRPALLWGFFIALLQVLVAINQWPLLWMDYDTALSAESFLLRQVVMWLATFLGLGVLFSVTFMAAEGLTRRAFPGHIRLWRLWTRPVAATAPVAGRTVGGYLLVAVFFAYEVGLYFFSSRWLGWWTPSSALFDPNVLATVFPWLTSVAVSLQAGFWEECLFRAVPIASAALLGERFGGRRLWITGALIVQALVFGAGHANYPAQPAYARVAELIVPALLFGWVYLRWGLLTGIVLHFTFDVTWFATPLFVSTAPGAWVDQAMVILLTLVPLWLVLGARWRSGRWEPLSDAALNGTWQPPPPRPRTDAALEIEPRALISPATRRGILAAGVLALVAWVFVMDTDTEAPPIHLVREQALARARQELAARSIVLPRSWRALAGVAGEVDSADRFVWRQGGEGAYRRLFGSYLSPPHWRVRFARFEGDVAERAEEYQVFIGPGGGTLRFRHRLPEARPGARLKEPRARERAYHVVRSLFGLHQDQVEEVSAVPSTHAHREDWRVTFADRQNYPLDEGEARVAVEIAGDEVVDAYRWVHVPEDWQRRDRERATRAGILSALCWVAIVVCLMVGLAVGIIAWSRRRFDRSLFLTVLALLGMLQGLQLANSWPSIVYRFSTAQPLELQALSTIGMGFVSLLVTAAAPALLIGFVHAMRTSSSDLTPRNRLLLGLALGTIATAVVAAVEHWSYPSLPEWPNYSPLGTYSPLFSTTFVPFVRFVRLTALLLLLFAGAHRITRGWKQRRLPVTFGLLVVGLVLGGLASQGEPTASFASGCTMGGLLVAAYILLVRYELALVPLGAAVLQCSYTLQAGLEQPFTAALPGALLAVIVILWASILWSGKLHRARPVLLDSARPS